MIKNNKIDYEQHISDIRAIFDMAMSKNSLSIALKAKTLEVKMQQQYKSDTTNKINIEQLSDNDINQIISDLELTISKED